MSLTEACKELGITYNTAYALIKNGTLKPEPVNNLLRRRKYRFDREYIEKVKKGESV